jgi:hypothetical protein
MKPVLSRTLLAAACSILEIGNRLRETVELEARLQEVEAQLGNARPRGTS